MRALHRNLTTKRAEEKKSNIDIYLSRLSHLAQIGLLIVAVIGYFYTVVPLYQKSLLDEQIAQKELELKASKVALEENYRELRRGLVNSYVFYVGAECSGVLERPRKPLAIGAKPISNIERYGKAFELDVKNCLNSELMKRDKLKKTLRIEDFNYLFRKVKDVGNELNKQRSISLEEFNAFTGRVNENPNILEPLERDSFTSRYFQIMKPYMSPESYQKSLFQARVDQGLSKIANDYKAAVRDKIDNLSEIDWRQASSSH